MDTLQKNLSALALIVACLALGVVLWGRYSPGEAPQSSSGLPPAANEAGQAPSQAPVDLSAINVQGTVTKVSCNAITVALLVPDGKGGTVPTGGPDTPTTIVVGQATKLYKAGAQLDPAEYKKRYQAFDAALKANPVSGAIYPANFEEIPITLGDIAVGAHIAAFNDPATRAGDRVTAVQIILFP